MVSASASPELTGAVIRYTGYRERLQAPVRRREVPQPFVVVILSFGDHMRAGGDDRVSFAAGISERPDFTEHAGRQHGVQVNLSPLAAAALLGVPARQLTHRVVDLDALLGAEARRLTDRLCESKSWPARFDLLNGYLEARLARGPQPSGQVRYALARLVRSQGRVRVEALARELGWSRRTLSERFHDEVGVPPKRFARLLRFQSAVGLLNNGSCGSLTTVAHTAGYADQAHFNHEFLTLAGCTPRQFLAARVPGGAGVQA